MSIYRNAWVALGILVALQGVAACSSGTSSSGTGTPPPSSIPKTPTPLPSGVTPTPIGSAGIATIIFTGAQVQSNFTLVVQKSGASTLTIQGHTLTETVTATHAAQLYTDLNAAVKSPGLGSLVTTTPCPKPSAFPAGYTDQTFVQYMVQETPDLSCGGNSQVQALHTDVRNAETDAGLSPT